MSTNWQIIQHDIWQCDACTHIDRVELNIRQQTQHPTRPVRLLVVGIAPPFKKLEIREKIPAQSATNDPSDNLREFLETTCKESWEGLIRRGLFVLHATKCAIQPYQGHQNPPNGVVEECVPRHLFREFVEIKPRLLSLLVNAPSELF